jgi:signal transduction histidine kinase
MRERQHRDLASEELRQSERMNALIQLAGTVSHELNNIFTAVAGNLSLLDHELAGDQLATFQDVLQAAKRGIDLTSKLQAFAGRQNLVRRNTEIHAVATKALAAQRQALEGVSLLTVFAPEDFIVYIDEAKLFDTIVELVRNARAAMPQTGGRLTVKTARQAHSNGHPHVLLSISDNGCGMAPEVIARATEPLFTTGARGIKVGWGLSSSAGFIRQSGGVITIASTPQLGTTVKISLPLENG